MSYLGKISAIVSANTSDFQSKLAGSAKDVSSWAASVTNHINRAGSSASSSLRSIYTDAQKLGRSLEAVKAGFLNYKGFDAKDLGTAIGRMEALYSVTKQINQPLSEAARNLEKLPAEIQAGFLPAMISAQAATERLAAEINETGSASQAQFGAVANKVDLVAASMRRLQEVTGMVGKLSRGDSFKFTSPRSFDSMTAASRAQEASANIPASVLARFGVGEQQGKVKEAADRVARLEAVRERKLALGMPTNRVDAMIDRENDRLEAQVRVLDRRNEAAQKFALIVKGGFVSSDDLAKSSKGMDKGAFVSSDELMKQAAETRKDVLRRLSNSSNFVSSDDLAKSSKGMDKGAFQPLGDLQKSAADLRTMQDEMLKLKAASNFGTTLDEAFEASKISRAKAEISALQGILIKIGATTGSAAEAVDDFAAGWQRATSEVGGTIKYAKQLKEVADDAAEAVQAAVNSSAAAGGPKIDVKKVLANVGDVGRFGADKASLAFQQLGFAIDDFMSSTGGIDQKIRAVSNNISQMAFIIGSTKGLFAALGVTMAAQAAVMVYKYVAGGKAAEDQTKALNDALAKQKSLIEDLKQAFESFANMLGRNIFSKSAGDARDFQKQIEEIVKKQKERRDARLANLSPDVQKERAEQNRISRELEGATDMGQRAALLAQRAASERREKEAAKAAAAAPAPSREEIDLAIQATIRANEFLEGGKMTARSERAAEARRQQAEADVAGASTAQKQADVVRARIAERQEMASRPITAMSLFGGEATEIMRAREDVAALEVLLAQLEEKVKDGGNALAVSILEGSVRVAKSLEATQQLLDGTLIPFSQTRAEADAAAAELTKVVEELKTAENPARIAELEKQRAALEQQSAQYRSAAEVIRTFADTVKRIGTDLVNAAEGDSQSLLEKARRDAVAAVAADELGGEFGPNGERRRAGDAASEADFQRSRFAAAREQASRVQSEADRVRAEIDQERRRFESQIAGDPQVQAERKRLEELQAVIDSKEATADEKSRAAEEKLQIQRTQDRRIEGSEAGRRIRELTNRLLVDAAITQEEQRQAEERRRAALRGRDIGLSEGARAAREARGGLLDIGDARDLGMLTPRQAQSQANRFAQDQMRAAAPAIFEMADAVQNAILQGPSRQALEMTDVSTMEGSKELNRLLRGDDASKNANIVELEKQNQKLTELVTTMKDVAQKMGIVLDL